MNQLMFVIRLFIQSIIFTFRNAQLFLYIGIYTVAHFLVNRFIFPSLQINAQTINEQFNIQANYYAGITSSLSSLALLSFVFNIVSFFIFYMLIAAITDYASHLMHKRRESILSSLKKSLLKIGRIIGYLGLTAIFAIFGPILSFVTYRLIIYPLHLWDPSRMSLIAIFIVMVLIALFYSFYEVITFYFFPAITIDNMHFVAALKQSWKTVKKTIFAIIGVLLLWATITVALTMVKPASTSANINIMFGATLLTMIGSILSWTIITVFKTMLYEKTHGSLPKTYDPEA